MVLARQYRPKALDQLVGQQTVVRTLTNAMNMKKLHHAYLFVGQIGSGKTTTARILAAMENCGTSPGLHPCGKCDICLAIFEGKHADVKEIDAASEAGSVEQIRELKKEALYNPVDGAKIKYFIIDEAHRMSQQAGDALLKLLEEPPPKARFVLCTTEINKMRPAIVSRCQKHDFTKIFWMQIAEYLTNVAKEEKLNVEAGAINICAKRAHGSMRNALGNLEKLITNVGNGSVSTANAEKIFGDVSELAFCDLFDELLKSEQKIDATPAFKILNKLLMTGAEFPAIASGLIEYLDMMVVGMTCSKAAEFVHLTDDSKNRLVIQLKKCMEKDKLVAILKSMDKLSAATQWVAYNGNPESALRKWFIESILEFRS